MLEDVCVVFVLLFEFVLITVRGRDTMLVVTGTGDGVYRVELTDMHRDCLDKACGTTGASEEAMLGLFIGSGMVELEAFIRDPLTASPPPKSLEQRQELDDV